MAQLKSVLLAAVVLLCSAAIAYPQAGAPAPPEARAMCMTIEKGINASGTGSGATSCRVGGGNTPESVSFLVVSLTVVWDDAEAKQLWFQAVVEHVGAALNGTTTTKVDEIIVADPSQLADRVAWGLPAAAVKDLQAKVKDGSVKKDEVYPLIEKALVKKPILSR
jgi:hypothetical protein